MLGACNNAACDAIVIPGKRAPLMQDQCSRCNRSLVPFPRQLSQNTAENAQPAPFGRFILQSGKTGCAGGGTPPAQPPRHQ
eukprot:1036923-Amphidinium_carterae.3